MYYRSMLLRPLFAFVRDEKSQRYWRRRRKEEGKLLLDAARKSVSISKKSSQWQIPPIHQVLVRPYVGQFSVSFVSYFSQTQNWHKTDTSWRQEIWTKQESKLSHSWVIANLNFELFLVKSWPFEYICHWELGWCKC